MRDCCCNSIASANLLTQDISYKDVVVVGNGPSGISLSALLSGYRPYYNGKAHPDEMLTARLRSLSNEKSLLEHDLQVLAHGLEGRSRNPISALVDSLSHPYDDQDIENASNCLISWKYHPEKAVDHVVLGKGKPGGSWQNMNGDLGTVSISSWMELPKYTYGEWALENIDLENSDGANNNRNTNVVRTSNCCSNGLSSAADDRTKSLNGRTLVKNIARYYCDYIKKMKLSKNFHNFTYVTSVKKIKNFNNQCNALKSYFQNEDSDDNSAFPEWEVDYFDTTNCCHYRYVCRKVVLANGTSDNWKTLNVPGELSNQEWILHNFNDFTSAVDNILYNNDSTTEKIDPVLIIGSGLTAADCVLLARHHKIPVIHVFSTCSLLDNRILPKSMYPEYNKVCKMMKGEKRKNRSYYKPLGQYFVSEISNDKTIRLMSPDGQCITYKVSLVAIAIGCSPDFGFLPAEFMNGKTLGVHKNQPIDSRKNPIDINPWTYEVVNSYSGMYAMGPIVGDNLVRTLVGASFTITKHIYEDRRRKR